MQKLNFKHVHPCPGFIAAQIRHWRKKVGVTQKTLSEISGIKYRHLQDIESGKVDLKVRTLGLIAMSLEITPHLLLTPVEENRPLMCEQCRDMF